MLPTKREKGRPNLMTLWQGKVRNVIARCSDSEVRVLFNLIWHKRMMSEQKYLVFDRAIFDVWCEREADRAEERRIRRKRARSKQGTPPDGYQKRRGPWSCHKRKRKH